MRFPRLLVVMLIAFVVIIALAACVPAQSEPLSGRLAFDAWLADNGIHQTTGDLSGYPNAPCGGYLADLKLAITDHDCIDRSTHNPLAHEWIPVHEAGHAVDIALGFPQGADRVGVERGSQCVTKVVLGYSYGSESGDPAYWDCPADQVERTRQLMVEGGMW